MAFPWEFCTTHSIQSLFVHGLQAENEETYKYYTWANKKTIIIIRD